MKNLLIMRHAKSDWGNSSLSDFDRPLNTRGKKSAPIIANELVKRNKIPDLIISSPANRARSTAEIIAKNTGYDKIIQFEDEFYFGYIDEIIRIINNSNDSYASILIVGHNPTFENLVHELLIREGGFSMPTASVVSINFNNIKWTDIKRKTGILEWFISPKELII